MYYIFEVKVSARCTNVTFLEQKELHVLIHQDPYSDIELPAPYQIWMFKILLDNKLPAFVIHALIISLFKILGDLVLHHIDTLFNLRLLWSTAI